MITDPVFWLTLLAMIAASVLAPSRIRFPLLATVSIGYLFHLLQFTSRTPLPDYPNLLSIALQPHFGVAYFLLALVTFAYFTPAICKRFNVKYGVLQLVLIFISLGYLAYNKYLPTFVGYLLGQPIGREIIAPLGVSYFTFKLIHYSVEFGRGNIKQHSFSQFATYIFLFPIYTAGPIERFDHFQNNWISEDRKNDIVEGCTRIIYGLIKKFVIASLILTPLLIDNNSQTILADIDDIAAYEVWFFLLISYLLIYLDFSAYSDIAIGTSRLLGFQIMENFNWPILATNISMLWKRWHMTLSGWCQTYVYMPTIGLTRNPYAAVVATFLAVGIWHGAALSWIAWGLYQGVGVLIFIVWSKYRIRKKIKIPQNVYTRNLTRFITNSWMAGSFSFTVTMTDGSVNDLLNAFRLLGKCIFIL